MIWINKIIPIKGFIAMAIFPFIFVRKEYKDNFNNKILNHEKIHFEQQKEMFILLFYIWYLVEFLIKSIFIGDGYKNLSFEREANKFENDFEYLKNRKRYSFIKFLWHASA